MILTNANTCTLSASWRSAVALSPDKQTTQCLWLPLPSPTSFTSLHHHTSTEEGKTWPTLPAVPKPWFSSNWVNLFLQVLWTALDIIFFCPFHKVGREIWKDHLPLQVISIILLYQYKFFNFILFKKTKTYKPLPTPQKQVCQLPW